MILFTPSLAEKIISGEKTQTRRCWRTRRCKPGSEHWAQLNLKPDSRFARLKIDRVWEWDGINISREDAIAEGFEDEMAFSAAYSDLNAHKVGNEDRTHYAIAFEVSYLVYAPALPDNVKCALKRQMERRSGDIQFDGTKFHINKSKEAAGQSLLQEPVKESGALTEEGLRTVESLKKKYTGVQRDRMVFGKWVDDEKVEGD